jgi:hypothetical protein
MPKTLISAPDFGTALLFAWRNNFRADEVEIYDVARDWRPNQQWKEAFIVGPVSSLEVSYLQFRSVSERFPLHRVSKDTVIAHANPSVSSEDH